MQPHLTPTSHLLLGSSDSHIQGKRILQVSLWDSEEEQGLWERLRTEATHSAGTVHRNQLIKGITHTHTALVLRASFSGVQVSHGIWLGEALWVPGCTGSHALELRPQDAQIHMPWSWNHRMHGFTCSGAGVTGCTGTHALELESQDAQIHVPWSWGHSMHRYTCPGAGVTGCMDSHALEQGHMSEQSRMWDSGKL